MNTIRDLLEKFKVSLELNEEVKNHKLTECNINHITDYHTENHEKRTIHVFSGNINDNTTEVEYILDIKDNKIIWTYLAKHPNQTDKRMGTQTIFDDKLSIRSRTHSKL